jgi:hypothetical protein
MNRTSVVAPAVLCAGLILGAVACKGETKVEDSPQTLAKLSDCEQANRDKDEYIKELHARVVELEMNAGDVVVTLQGDAFTVTGGKGPNVRAARPTGETDDNALYQSFINSVNASRAGMTKCYENALKRDTGLQARTVTLNIQVRFTTAGKPGTITLDPRISEAFDACMQTLIGRWSLPAAPTAVTFRAPVTLTPQ